MVEERKGRGRGEEGGSEERGKVGGREGEGGQRKDVARVKRVRQGRYILIVCSVATKRGPARVGVKVEGARELRERPRGCVCRSHGIQSSSADSHLS